MGHAVVVLSTLTLASLNACVVPTEPEPTIRVQVQGTVTAADGGSPIAGAVLVAWSLAGLQLNFLARDTTDVSGDYSLSFGVARNCPLFRMDASHPGFVTRYFSVLAGRSIQCTEEPQTIDVQLVREPT